MEASPGREVSFTAATNDQTKSRGQGRGFTNRKYAFLVSCRPGLGRRIRRDQTSIRRGYQTLLDLRQLRPLYVPSQSQLLQCPDSVPVGVNFIPDKTVRGRGRMCVVIVIPALGGRHQAR